MIAPSTAPAPAAQANAAHAWSERAHQLAAMFGIPFDRAPTTPPPALQRIHDAADDFDCPAPGLTLCTGPSGAGKTTFIQALTARWQREERTVIDVAAGDHPSPRTRVIDCFTGPLAADLRLLASAGLADARCALQPVHTLSAGQHARLRIALALARCRDAHGPAPPVLIIDEFASLLDRLTASALARSLRTLVSRARLSCIVATAHDDLDVHLAPDCIAHCSDGGHVEVFR